MLIKAFNQLFAFEVSFETNLPKPQDNKRSPLGRRFHLITNICLLIMLIKQIEFNVTMLLRPKYP